MRDTGGKRSDEGEDREGAQDIIGTVGEGGQGQRDAESVRGVQPSAFNGLHNQNHIMVPAVDSAAT